MSSHTIPATAQRYVVQREREFALKEKAFGFAEKFTVQDTSSGDQVFEIKGKLVSANEKKTLADAEGNEIYTLSEAMFSAHDRMSISGAESGDAVVTLKKTRMVVADGTVNVWKGGDDEGEPYLRIGGNILRKSFKIEECESGNVVAQVKRTTNATTLFTDADHYALTVCPGVDAALMVILVVALDEVYRDDD